MGYTCSNLHYYFGVYLMCEYNFYYVFYINMQILDEGHGFYCQTYTKSYAILQDDIHASPIFNYILLYGLYTGNHTNFSNVN